MADAPVGHTPLTRARVSHLDRSDVDLLGVRDHVAASWRRSLARGVDPATIANRYHPDLDLDSRLVRCAQPVIDRLAEQIADVPVCIALTDDHARLVVRRDTGRGIGLLADGNNFATGFGYGEGEVGTNGVGTVLESGESVHIVGAEHFVERLQGYACAGAPVRDPLTRRIEGVLDVSCRSEHSSPVLHSLVRSAAAQIQDALLHDRDAGQQALLDAWSRVDTRGRRAVLAVGGRTVLTNVLTQTLLEPGDLLALQDHMRFVMLRAPSTDDRVDLPSGTRVRLRGTVVTVGDSVAGMIGTVSVPQESTGDPTTVHPRSRSADPAPDAPGPAAGSRSPAWRTAWTAVTEALRESSTAVLVLGEPGSGRSRMLADVDRLLHGPGHVVPVRPEQVAAAPDAVADRIRCPDPVRLLVLSDVDRLPAGAVETLAAALDTARPADRPLRIAATASYDALGGPAYGALLDRFRWSATVPPLRNRSGDLPALAGALLAELAPQREIRLSPAALRRLTRHTWPGNVTELRDALAAALRRRPVGSIEPADLPESCQSAPRSSLRAVDQAERDAIVGALRDAGGNRVAAATALGLARSTLYRKIRLYGISD
ncbi:sigma-54-dependent Fis family transcriptional regulator [Pseudonocardia nantongensis]|uniref:sigma-54-dependent Fis family transcriptional regulator n=1 Tax=Pseudonocardia nantongensis TaxID=1181885 RepID=UPI00397B3C1C